MHVPAFTPPTPGAEAGKDTGKKQLWELESNDRVWIRVDTPPGQTEQVWVWGAVDNTCLSNNGNGQIIAYPVGWSADAKRTEHMLIGNLQNSSTGRPTNGLCLETSEQYAAWRIRTEWQSPKLEVLLRQLSVAAREQLAQILDAEIHGPVPSAQECLACYRYTLDDPEVIQGAMNTNEPVYVHLGNVWYSATVNGDFAADEDRIKLQSLAAPWISEQIFSRGWLRRTLPPGIKPIQTPAQHYAFTTLTSEGWLTSLGPLRPSIEHHLVRVMMEEARAASKAAPVA